MITPSFVSLPHAAALDRLEDAVGYRFRNRALLVQAVTHSSYSNETGERNHHLLCNERLEFLGDSVLSIAVSRYLYTDYPREAEGLLTVWRTNVVRADALARYAREIRLGDCLLLGRGEEATGGRDKDNILADAFEAMLAAMYLDAGGEGLSAVSKFLLPFVKKDLTDPDAHGLDCDYKSTLQQLVQQTGGDILEYVIIRADGPDHKKEFEVEVRINSNPFGRGVGSAKRKAEQAAARAALRVFGIE